MISTRSKARPAAKHILYGPETGVGVAVLFGGGVRVWVGVGVDVLAAVRVGVGVRVAVEIAVGVRVRDGVAVRFVPEVGVGVRLALAVGLGPAPPPTCTASENSEVLPFTSVAVAVINLPARPPRSVTVKLPLALGVALASNRCPSPYPDGSAASLLKNSRVTVAGFGVSMIPLTTVLEALPVTV